MANDLRTLGRLLAMYGFSRELVLKQRPRPKLGLASSFHVPKWMFSKKRKKNVRKKWKSKKETRRKGRRIKDSRLFYDGYLLILEFHATLKVKP